MIEQAGSNWSVCCFKCWLNSFLKRLFLSWGFRDVVCIVIFFNRASFHLPYVPFNGHLIFLVVILFLVLSRF